jgi:hypothetical protein
MSEVTKEAIYELAKQLLLRFDQVDDDLANVSSQIHSLRGTVVSMQSDIHNIYWVINRQGDRLTRIEQHLDRRDLTRLLGSDPHP